MGFTGGCGEGRRYSLEKEVGSRSHYGRLMLRLSRREGTIEEVFREKS